MRFGGRRPTQEVWGIRPPVSRRLYATDVHFLRTSVAKKAQNATDVHYFGTSVAPGFRNSSIIKSQLLISSSWLFLRCLGWDSNPYEHFCSRDFLTTMAFATITVCGPDYSFTMESCSLGVPCLVSAPSFNLKAWLKIAFSITC